MKLNIILFFISFFLIFHFPNEVNSCSIYEIIKNDKNNITDINTILELIHKLKYKDASGKIMELIFQFIINYTNIKAEKGESLLNCLGSIDFEKGGSQNYYGIIGFSGKGVSDFGLEEECLRNDFVYYLLTYEYINGSYVTFSDQTNTFLFFEQNIFYTGLCLTLECNEILNFLFNKTVNDIFYKYLLKNLTIQNTRIYDIGRVDKNFGKKEPYITYDDNGAYNPRKTDSELKKYNEWQVIRGVVRGYIITTLLISLFIHLFYKPYIKTKELKNEIEEEDSNCETEEENNENKQIFNRDSKKEEKKKKKCITVFGDFIYNYISLFNNLKILLKKKNQIYDSSNLEIISVLRVFCMILITFINNFEVLIKIPSKDFFYDKFYQKFTFFILKFTSFGVDMWICLDGFESMYKLISYYKKYVFVKNKASITFGQIIAFYFYSFYKIIAFIFFFLIVNYYNKYYIYSQSYGTLYEYYSNHIYKDNKEVFLYLIPRYTFYKSYYEKLSLTKDTFISKFSLLFINEFYIYTIFLFIFYISNILKSKIFDYLVLIINIILYSLNFIICRFESDTYYSYKLVLDNFITVRYPHIIFNYFFFGAMAGLICFYYKDSFSNNSLSNDNINAPFRYCYNIITFFDYLIQNGRIFWIILILILQLSICFSFNILLYFNENSLFIPFNTEQKIVLCYETGLFILFFCAFIILIYFIKNENENKEKNYASFLFLIERTNFSFLNFINLILYDDYCLYKFQLKLSYQNLWIITFGLFFLVCYETLILTLPFIFLFKMANKKIIKYFLSSKDRIEIDRISTPEELLEKSRDSLTIK